MALTGIDIFKQLPKTNCRECGQPTCLAFAMKLAQKQASLDQCPHVSEEAKAALAGASAPPIKLITIGVGERKLEIGNETVLFRHEETFHHPTGLAVTVDASLPEAELAERVKEAAQVGFERVGQTLCLSAIALKGEGEAFVKAAKVVADSELPVILMNEDPGVMGQALAVCAAKRPLIYAATAENVEAMAALAKQHNCPLAIRGSDLSSLAELSEKAQAAGATDLVLDSGARTAAAMLADETAIRRAAIKKRFRPLGFPTIGFAAADDDGMRPFLAATQIMKYAGLVVLDGLTAPELLALLTVRQNIFTDPQKPIQIQEGLYTIRDAGGELAGARDDELLPHVLHGGRGCGGEPGAGVGGSGEHRRHVGADRVGGGEVHGRDHRAEGEGLRRRQQGEAPQADPTRPRRGAQRQARGSAGPGMEGARRTARVVGNPFVPAVVVDGIAAGSKWGRGRARRPGADLR